MSGVPQGVILGLVFFNIFINDIEVEFEGTLSKAADDILLCDAVDTTERRNVTQRDLERLDKWTYKNLMRLNKTKCEVMSLGQGNRRYEKNSLRAALRDGHPGGPAAGGSLLYRNKQQ